jgi:hypothetical protein
MVPKAATSWTARASLSRRSERVADPQLQTLCGVGGFALRVSPTPAVHAVARTIEGAHELGARA